MFVLDYDFKITDDTISVIPNFTKDTFAFHYDNIVYSLSKILHIIEF